MTRNTELFLGSVLPAMSITWMVNGGIAFMIVASLSMFHLLWICEQWVRSLGDSNLGRHSGVTERGVLGEAKTNNLTVIDVADVLDAAPRMGADRDNPEGSRYIQISDTLTKQLSDTLRGAHEHA